MRKKSIRGVLPIYVFGIIWLVCGLLLPLFRMGYLVLTLALALSAGLGLGLLLRPKAKAVPETAPEAAPEPDAGTAESEMTKSYGTEVDAIISEGRLAMREMGRLYSCIRNPEVRKKINEIMSVSDKIVRDAIHDPSDVPQIRKFLNYYLPTTIKLLNAYDRMSEQGIEGENISGSMSRIEEMLDTAIAAYKKQLDSLFANQALDIETDIRAMNGLLAREGLGGKSFLDLKDFLKNASPSEGGSASKPQER